MTFYSRESGVNLGTLVVRHTLSPGGGCIKAHLMNAPDINLNGFT
jgi:hypothetical protein